MSLAPRFVIVIGRNGQLARELGDLVWPTLIRPYFLGRGGIDLFDTDALTARLSALQPMAIINTAAHTAVDAAELNPALAIRLNAEAPRNLACAARRAGVPLIHVSTDYVFAGTQQIAYREDDTAAPISVYGTSKREGEIALFDSGAQVLIVRSAGLFGSHGQNFLKTILTKVAVRPTQPLSIVNDQIVTPTPAALLAAAILQMTLDLSGGRILPTILHFAGQPATSWFDFTSAICSILAATGRIDLPDLVPVASMAYPRPALRPAFSALDCSLADSLGYPPPDWRAALPSLIARLAKERIAA